MLILAVLLVKASDERERRCSWVWRCDCGGNAVEPSSLQECECLIFGCAVEVESAGALAEATRGQWSVGELNG